MDLKIKKYEEDTDKYGAEMNPAVLADGRRVYLREVDMDDPDERAAFPEGGWHAYGRYSSREGHTGYIGPVDPPPRRNHSGGV